MYKIYSAVLGKHDVKDMCDVTIAINFLTFA